jgi:hypothetical protein
LSRQSVHRIRNSTFVTIAKRPSLRAGTGELVEMICPTWKARYFFDKDWTGQIRLKGFDKFDFWRKCPGPVFSLYRPDGLKAHKQVLAYKLRMFYQQFVRRPAEIWNA